MVRGSWSEVVEALAEQYGLVDALLASLAPEDLAAPSGCSGWSDTDLVFHMLLDAQRALVAFHSPVAGPADRDFISYWNSFRASHDSAVRHARFVRETVAALSNVEVLRSWWSETARAAVHAARGSEATSFVTTQGHVLATEDFIATLAVEATVHHLDLVKNLEVSSRPGAAAVAITRRTIEGLLGHPMPGDWDETSYILKTTGRAPVDEDDETALGAVAALLPAFS